MVKLKFSAVREGILIRKWLLKKIIIIFDWEEKSFRKLNLLEILEKKQNW